LCGSGSRVGRECTGLLRLEDAEAAAKCFSSGFVAADGAGPALHPTPPMYPARCFRRALSNARAPQRSLLLESRAEPSRAEPSMREYSAVLPLRNCASSGQTRDAAWTSHCARWPRVCARTATHGLGRSLGASDLRHIRRLPAVRAEVPPPQPRCARTHTPRTFGPRCFGLFVAGLRLRHSAAFASSARTRG
jgi:hypothetical protein